MDTFESVVKQKTDRELVDIFINQQDYQENFLICIEKELECRKISLESVKKERHQVVEMNDEKLRLGEQGNPIWITLCFIMAICGGFLSIVGGYIYYFSKRKTSKGEVVYTYNQQTRKYGKWMLIIGSIIVFICFLNFLHAL